MKYDLPVIDLLQLEAEVVSRGAEAALPCNLSDHWLRHISYSLDQVLQMDDGESTDYFNAPMVLVSNLLLKKSGAAQIRISFSEIIDRFREYRLELALEEVSRLSDIKVSAATFETIFTNRRVEFIQKNCGL
ncbi:hypothetical protein [Massilia niastensis]|uniref:hypothetical protein n=1 Tax=Massilia niastensis TaxID=544911 RepID=UPI0012ECAE4E|nr:hypothetical protein [Massilia niastensis]